MTAFPPKARVWVLGAVLVAAIIFAYQPAWNAGFIWDDDLYVTENPLLTAPDGLRRIWFSTDSPSQYFPLTYTTFRFEHALWGFNASGYHWVNILIHAANALLLWRVLWRLQLPGAWLAAALFALHPVQVESVAWITERKNVLTLLFSLLTMLAWMRFTANERQSPWREYAAALIFYLLALFSKTTACTVPAAMVLVLWLKHKPVTRQRLAQIVPFLVIGIGMGLLTVWWERYQQGAEGKFFTMTLLERTLVASRAVWFYAGKLVWPFDLCFSYPRWTISSADLFAYVWPLALVAAAAGIWLTRRFTGRGVETAAVFFVAMLSPLLGFFMLSTFRFTFVADHYQYVASIGPLTLAAAGITKWHETAGRKQPLLKPVACGALLLLLGVLTWRQAAHYQNLETLWRATIETNPGSFMARNNLGALLIAKGQEEEAMVHFQKAVEVEPQADAAAFNLANLLLARGRVDEAITNYRIALAVKPDGAAIAYNLGNAHLKKNQLEAAIFYYRMALTNQPDSTTIASSLINALLADGRPEEAAASFRAAMESAPDAAKFRANWANALIKAGRIRDAIGHYNSTLELEPDDVPALGNLAWILATCPDPALRDGAKAVELARRADQLTGGNSPVILRTLSAALAESGQFPEAIAAVEEAIALTASAGNDSFAGPLREQLELLRSKSPVRDPALTSFGVLQTR
ncbi:MAG TPA: tetratricopeptide repeat protein [Verrucomicrobiota bacterium]|nr:tetratricopeptide repeat protein [Verrucomicrobiota bacterium]